MTAKPTLRRGDLVRVEWASHSDDWPAFTVRYVGWDGVLLQGRSYAAGRHQQTHDGSHAWSTWDELDDITVEGQE